MATKIQSRDLYAILERGDLDANATHQAYNALDSAVTLRVWEALSQRVSADEHARTSYSFVRAMQGPALDMMRRGIAVQQKVRQDETARYQAIRAKAQSLLDRLADAIWGPETYIERIKTKEPFTPVGKSGRMLKPRIRTVISELERQRPRGLNANSTPQALAFFNIALQLPVEHEIRKTAHGTERTPSANDKALRKWAALKRKGPAFDARDRSVAALPLAAPFVSLILTIRDADKMLAVLKTPLDPDGRMRCSYNVVGTENGRWSSSKNAFGRGTNLQNITPTMRRMFCADDGQRMVSTDLEQAESRVVAGLVWQATGDDTYWRACLSGDLHTTVCKMTWPELGWRESDGLDKQRAEGEYPNLGGYSYRDVAKRIGHGSNYKGTPFGIAQAVGIPVGIVEDFQNRYFSAFRALSSWHEAVRTELRNVQSLATPLQRKRLFFGRPWDDATLREAIAFVPQSTVAELLNLIMWRVWRRSLLPTHDPQHLPIQLLLQNHDAFAFQIPEAQSLPTVIRKVNEEFSRATVPFERAGERRTLTIPGEFVTGWNWGYADDTTRPRAEWKFPDGNPDGLCKWRGADARRRTQRATVTPADWLSRPISRVYG